MLDRTRLNRIYLGGEFCLRKNVTCQQMLDYVHGLYEGGMRLIRVYPYWAHIEETKGVFELEPYDVCFKEAERLGMSIVFTFKPNSPPWWMGITSSYNLDDYPHVDEPEYWDAFLNYVRHIVRRYKDSPALLAWCVWNEPRITIPTQMKPQMLKEYRDFLRRRYNNDIQELDRLYFYQYGSFDEINPVEKSENPNGRRDMPEHMDFYRFATETLARKLKSISDAIKEIDPDHFTHINTHSTDCQPITLSHNIWKESESVDFIGTSNYPHYSDEFPDSARMNAFNCSLMKSATRDPDQRFWITEMQGGPAIYTGHTSGISVPEPEDLKLALWDYIGGGARACIYWSYTPTVRGEWQLCGFDGAATRRSRATREVFEQIEKNRALLESTTLEQPDVYILSCEASLIHDVLLGRPGGIEHPMEGTAHAHAQIGAHAFFTRMGYVCGFIDESRLEKEGLPANTVLVAPACTCLSRGTLLAMEKFVQEGGTLIADSLFGWKDEYAWIDPDNMHIADRIFGAKWIDFGDVRPGVKVYNSDGSEAWTPWFIRAVFEESPSVICRYSTGGGAAALNRYGKGKALRFGTDIFRRSLSADMSAAEPLIAPLLPAERKNGVWLGNHLDSLKLHIMHGKDEKVLVLVNYGDFEQTAQLNGLENIRLADMDADMVVSASSVIVPARSVRLLKAEV
jgi:beta-galactosidase GanA